jgi:hypothetical protein
VPTSTIKPLTAAKMTKFGFRLGWPDRGFSWQVCHTPGVMTMSDVHGPELLIAGASRTELI